MSAALAGARVSQVDNAGLLVGSWFSGFTWGILTLQLAFYFRSFPHDSLILKFAVGFVYFSETALSILFFFSAYRQCVTVVAGTIDSLIPGMAMICMPFLIWFDIGVVNAFLIWRYSRLTKRYLLSYGLYALATGGLACHFWATGLSVKLRTYSAQELANIDPDEHVQAKMAAKAGLSIEVGIVCLLLSLLRRDMQGARKLVIRLVVLTVESGTLATAVSLGTLVYYLHDSNSNLIVWASFMGRVYFMGMLFNLNFRTSGGRVMQDSVPSRAVAAMITTGSRQSYINASDPDENIHFPPRIILVKQNVTTKVEADEHDVEKDAACFSGSLHKQDIEFDRN